MSEKNGKTSELFRHISEYIGSEWSSEGYEFGGTFPDALSALFENKPGLYVIGARPANGKTTLMIQKALDLGKDENVYIYEADTVWEKIRDRMATALFGSISERDLYVWRKYMNAYLKSKPIYLCTEQACVEEICEELEDKKGYVFIDYLQLLGTKQSSESRCEERKIILGKLRELAADRPVFVFSQVNRSAAKNLGWCPAPDSIRFFSDICKYADSVTTFVTMSDEDGITIADFSVYAGNRKQPLICVTSVIDDETGLFID